ncbi:MAG: hypothetical protein ACRC7G_08245 [Beijerinckiaceae bacterium]
MNLRHLCLAVLAGVAAFGAIPETAKAQGIADIGRFILGLPAEDKPGANIDYRERAPLVVPPNTGNLRPPAERGAPDERRANWPRDPDVAARRKAAEEAGKPIFVPTDAQVSRVATREELAAQRRAGAGRTDASDTAFINDRGFTNQIGGIRALQAENQRSSGQKDLPYAEPKREFLTDPPTGLRAAAGTGPVRATRDNSTPFGNQAPDMFGLTREGPRTR